MAHLGRAHPARPAILSRRRHTVSAAVTLEAFETQVEWPSLTVTVPDARIALEAFETQVEWPPPGVSYGTGVTLEAFETQVEWPSPTVTVPIPPGSLITGPHQIEYGGLRFGGFGNPFQILEGTVEGWDDLPEVTGQNVERPSRHGSWPARSFAQERQVSAVIAISTAGDLQARLAELRYVFVPAVDEQEPPLVISTGDEVLMAYASPRGRLMPPQYWYQGWATVPVRWTCSDPRRYSVERLGVTVPLNTPTQLANAGNTAAHPIIRMEGPVSNPILTNAATGRSLQFAVTVDVDERLDVDPDAGTAAIGGDNVTSTLTGGSPIQAFVLERGTNVVTYTASSGGGAGADLLWRHAHL